MFFSKTPPKLPILSPPPIVRTQNYFCLDWLGLLIHVDAAEASFKDRQDLPGNKNGWITTHYSATGLVNPTHSHSLRYSKPINYP